MNIIKILWSLVPDFLSFSQILLFFCLIFALEMRSLGTKIRFAYHSTPSSSDVERVSKELSKLRDDLEFVGFKLEAIGLVLAILKIEEIKVAKRQN